jgi:ABC-type lipoprotein export system ATPase subunit
VPESGVQLSILRSENIHKSYLDTDKRVDVLRGIDLEVAEGETVAIVGPSGAGKSTFLHVLGGLDVPDQGKVFINGRDVYGLSDAERATARNREIGFVFQFYHLLPELSALDNVLLPILIQQNRHSRTSEMKDAAAVALGEVGLKDRMRHKPNQLSGGEQQRVAIARALICRPKIVLCDEPTGNLDSVTGDSVIDLLMALNARTRQAFVIVTHDDRVAARCRRNIHMRDGVLTLQPDRP